MPTNISLSTYAKDLYFQACPDEILLTVFQEVFKKAASVRDPSLTSCYLVSKRFRKLFYKAKQNYLAQLFPELQTSCPKLTVEAWLAGKNDKNETVLYQAIRDFFIEKATLNHLKRLLKGGIDLNSVNIHSHTPLCLVLLNLKQDDPSSYGKVKKLVELFLAYGANANGPPKKSPLLMILEHVPFDKIFAETQRELLHILCKAGADPLKKVHTIIQKKPLSAYERAEQRFPDLQEAMNSYITKAPPTSTCEKILSLLR